MQERRGKERIAQVRLDQDSAVCRPRKHFGEVRVRRYIQPRLSKPQTGMDPYQGLVLKLLRVPRDRAVKSSYQRCPFVWETMLGDSDHRGELGMLGVDIESAIGQEFGFKTHHAIDLAPFTLLMNSPHECADVIRRRASYVFEKYQPLNVVRLRKVEVIVNR